MRERVTSNGRDLQRTLLPKVDPLRGAAPTLPSGYQKGKRICRRGLPLKCDAVSSRFDKKFRDLLDGHCRSASARVPMLRDALICGLLWGSSSAAPPGPSRAHASADRVDGAKGRQLKGRFLHITGEWVEQAHKS